MMRIYAYLFVAIFIISSVNISAQPNGPWIKTINTPEKSFVEYQQEFYEYWDDKAPQKGQGYKQFKRWEYFWESRLTANGTLPTMAMFKAGVQTAKAMEASKIQGSGQWIPLGPFNYELTGSINGGLGRINVVTIDPNDTNIIYVGAPAGGIWKSVNRGQSWTVLNDDIGNIGVSDIAIDPNNSSILYIATGDSDGKNTYSTGIMKSIDGGINWNDTGLDLLSSFSTINNLLIDPEDSQILYAGTSFGLYKSTDAGVTFSIILSIVVRDIVIKPGDSQTIYTMSNDNFYKSTNKGVSFSIITSGLPTTDIGRSVIGVSPAEPDYVYLLMSKFNNEFKGLYRSTNSGNSFSLRNNTSFIYDFSSQAWYDLAIAVDPTDAEIVYTGVLNIWKSTNGGSNFSRMNNWFDSGSPAYTHADIHYLGFYNNALYCGSDGGVYKSIDEALSFEDLTEGLQIGQYYTIDGIESNEKIIAGGLQDNGGFFTVTAGSEPWKNYHGGDGMGSAVNPDSPDIVYGMSQFGSLHKSIDGGNSSVFISSPEPGAWVVPFQLDPNNPDRLIAGYSQLYEYVDDSWNVLTSFNFGGKLNQIEVSPSNSDVIYASYRFDLFKITNGGATVTQLSGLPADWVSDIVVHDSNPDIIWVTLSGWTFLNKVVKSTDGGITWVDMTGSLPNLPISCIDYQHESQGGVYIGNDFGVYYYDDVLTDWIPFNTGLPHTIITDIEVNHTASVVTAATFGRGVWQSPLYNTTLLSLDPAIIEVKNIENLVCNSSISPIVIVRNLGIETLTTFELEYGVGNYNFSFVWNGILESLDTININLEAIALFSGENDFLVRLVNPNNNLDDNEPNNSKVINFVASTDAGSISFYLRTDCKGNETSWEIRDSDSTIVISGDSLANREEYEDLICLNSGCYQFIIYDTGGNGLDGILAGCEISGSYHILNSDGDTLVEMTTTNFGFEATHNFCIENNGLVVDINSASGICNNSTFDFMDLSDGNPTSWFWEFDGGNPANSNLQNPSNIIFDTPGNYDVTLTIVDANGEAAIKIFEQFVNASENLMIQLDSTTNLACFGNSDGIIEVSTSAGNAPFQYSLDGGALQSTGVFSGLNVGIYTIQVNDALGCTSNIEVEISQPEVLISDIALIEQITCFGNTDGQVMIEAIGGTSPYQYSLMGGPFLPSNIFSGLLEGVYSYVVKDALDCIVSGEFIITEPEQLAAVIQTEDLACFNSVDGGSYNIVPSGGTGDLTIVGLNQQGVNVPAGNYMFSVSDINGCSQDFNFEILEPTELLSSASVVETCFNLNNGEAEFTGQGGTPPYTYSVDEGAAISENVFTNLVPGLHIYSIIDANGCESVNTFNIIEFDELIASVSQTQEIGCFGDANAQIVVAASGGTSPYTYAIEGGVSSGSGVFGELGVGSHSVIITDDNNCTLGVFVTINEPEAIEVVAEPINITCFGSNDGSVTLFATGGIPPFDYALNESEFTEVNTFENLVEGDFTYFVRDANGCIVDGAFTLNEPEEMVINSSIVLDEVEGNDGSIEIDVTGGTLPYTFQWSNGSNNQNISELTAGVYTVVITDSNGCMYQESYTLISTVGVEELTLLNAVKVFPNPATNQVYIEVKDTYDEMLVALLTDDGKIVRSKFLTQKKNIEFNVSDLSAGTYFVKLTYKGYSKTIKVLLVK